MKEFDYSKLAQTAVNLIARFGKTIQLRAVTSSGDAFNPTQINVDMPIKAVITDYKNNEIDGTLIHTQDKKMLTTLKVELINSIVDNSTVYSIVSVNEVAPSTTTLVYKVQLRI